MLQKEKDMRPKKVISLKDRQKKQKLVERRHEYGKYVNRYYLPKVDESQDHHRSMLAERGAPLGGHRREHSGYLNDGERQVERQMENEDDIYEHMAEVREVRHANDALNEAQNACEPEVENREGSAGSKKSKAKRSQEREKPRSVVKSAEKPKKNQHVAQKEATGAKELKEKDRKDSGKTKEKSEAKVQTV